MASWRYVGYSTHEGRTAYFYWTNGVDTATCRARDVDSDRLSNIPPSVANIDYGLIEDEYNGDVIEWMDSMSFFYPEDL